MRNSLVQNFACAHIGKDRGDDTVDIKRSRRGGVARHTFLDHARHHGADQTHGGKRYEAARKQELAR
jgi:hypothetical protein